MVMVAEHIGSIPGWELDPTPRAKKSKCKTGNNVITHSILKDHPRQNIFNKINTMVNFVICIFYHIKKREKEREAQREQEEIRVKTQTEIGVFRYKPRNSWSYQN